MNHLPIRVLLLLVSLLNYALLVSQLPADDVNHHHTPPSPLFSDKSALNEDSETLKIKTIDTGNPNMQIVVVSSSLHMNPLTHFSMPINIT